MIERIVITALIVFAVWYSMQEGEIFGGLGKWFEKVLPEALHKPVFDCSICMAPWYGTGLYWLIWGNGFKEWIIVIIASMGFNVIITKLWPPDD